MTNDSHLCFISNIGIKKNTYQDSIKECPFCNRKELSNILDEEGTILLVKNKFPTLNNAFQTVIIENDDCLANISTYDKNHMRKIIKFGIDNWIKMENSGEFKSVVFYKNHGPLSGGTINHSHMQIVGLKYIDYRMNLKDDIFEGIEIYKETDCQVNISIKPNSCPIEYNIITAHRNDNFMADNIQNIVRYILKKCKSFNLFFYQWKGSIICKIVPRYVTSPFLIGFSIAQMSDRLNSIVKEIQKDYYS